MQTTLLGIGIAIILALGTALIGPFFIDWNDYRAVLEAQASQVVGTPVRVSGPISIRLLPTPLLRLDTVEIGPQASPVAAHKLVMEFGLGGLMRGEFRAVEMTVGGLEATLRLDRAGRIVTPLTGLAIDPDRVGIDRLAVANSRIVLADESSGGRLALDNFNFNGEVRSLLGPFKGEGSFTAHEGPYAFRIGGGRRGDDGGAKLRLFVDASASAVSFDADGTMWVEGNAPRFEGAMTVSRVVGAALPDGTTALHEPWKATAKVKATSAGAAVDDLEFQYGPEARPARLTGSAKFEFGAAPRAAATLTARQIDLDRTFTGADRRLPFDVVKAMAESLATGPAPPLPVRVTLGIDNLTMAGTSISMLRGDAESRADGWAIDGFEWRAPGGTQMRIGGKLAVADHKVAFTGPVRIDSADPGVFLAWIEGRAAAERAAVAPMRGSGVLTLASERIAVEDLSAEIDRKSVTGRAAYRFATAVAPARLDANLTAVELDLDRVLAIAESASTSTTFERPKEIALALDIGRTTYAGVEATKTHAVLGFDGTGLKIERLSIADIGGAAVEASGRIDNLASAGRGSVTLSLIAGRIDGIAGLAGKLMPQAVEPLRKYESRLGPLNIKAKLDVEPGKGAATSVAKLKLTGRIAGIDTTLDASGSGTLSNPGAAVLHLDGRLDAEDGRIIAAFSGLDQLVNMDRRPGRLTFTADGAAERSFRVDGKFAAGDIGASAAGTWKIGGNGTLDVALRAADAKLPRRAPATVPVDLRGKLAVDGNELKFSDLAGRLAGTAVKGRLTVGLGAVPRLDGHIEADQVDGAEVVAILIGAPRPAVRSVATAWPAEPFVAPALPTLAGRIEFRVGNVQWTPGIAARDLQGAIGFAQSGFTLDGVTGKLGDGRLELAGQMKRAADGTSLQSHFKVVNSDLAALLSGVTRVPVAGRISIDAEVQGQGMSPASLVGSLRGSGLATVENVEVGGLDPTAMDAAITAVDRGLAINSARIVDIVNAALDGGRLRLPFAAAPITIADGRAQLTDLAAPAQSADVAASLALALPDNQVDMRIALTGPQRGNAPAGERPSLAVAVKGPLAAAHRTADVTSLVAWLTSRAVEQETKRLNDAERERKRLEQAEPRRRQDAAALAEPESAVAATMGRAPDLPAPIEIKPLPFSRQPPPAAPAPAPVPRLAPGPLEWFLQQGTQGR